MRFDWTEYLNLALELRGDKLAKPISEEAKLRSSISRAYYSAFNLSLNYLKYIMHDSGIPQGKNTHKYVQEKFKNHSDIQLKAIGNDLDRLKQNRTKADYYQEIREDIKSMTFKSIRYAQNILERLK